MTRRVLVIAAAAALLKGLVLLWLIPPFQTPDEYGHYDYVLYLAYADPIAFARGKGLRGATLDPVAFATREVRCLADATGTRRHMDDAIRVRVTTSLADQVARADSCRGLDSATTLARLGRVNALFNYPPLYHVAAAGVHRVLRAGGTNPLVIFYAIRFCSVLLLVATLVVAARLLHALEVSGPAASTALLFIALHPQLSMLSAGVSPDMLGLALVTTSLLAMARLAEDPSIRRGVWLGVAIGALLLTKLHQALPLVFSGLTTLGVAAAVDRRRARAWLRPALAASTLAALVGGWWYVRSSVLFGNVAGLMETGPSLVVVPASPTDNLRAFLGDRLEPLFRSYWGVWGWLDYGVEPAAVPWLAVFAWLPAAIGLLAWLAWRRNAPAARAIRSAQFVAMGMVVGAMLLFALEMLYITARLGAVNDQGRHWLPYVFVHAIYFASMVPALSSASFSNVTTLVARARGTCVAAAVTCAGLAIAGAAFWAVVNSPTGYVEVDLQSSVDSRLDVWIDAGAREAALEPESVAIRKRDGMVTRRLPVRSAVVHGLRLDPIAAPGWALVGPVRLTDAAGRQLATIPVDAMRATQHVANSRIESGRMLVETTPDGADPILEAALPSALAFDLGAARRAVKRARPLVLGLYRRVPAAEWIVPLAPTFAVLALIIGSLVAASRRDRAESASAARRWRAVWVWSVPTLLVALNAWLALQTWVYYRG